MTIPPPINAGDPYARMVARMVALEARLYALERRKTLSIQPFTVQMWAGAGSTWNFKWHGGEAYVIHSGFAKVDWSATIANEVPIGYTLRVNGANPPQGTNSIQPQNARGQQALPMQVDELVYTQSVIGTNTFSVTNAAADPPQDGNGVTQVFGVVIELPSGLTA